MSVFSFSRDTISTQPTLSAIAGGTTTAAGTLFFKVFNQNLAGNNFGSTSASISWTAGQQVRVQVPAAMRATGEFVERFIIAGSSSGSAGTWVQLAAIEAVDVNGAALALPLTVDLSSDYDLSLNKAAATVAALPDSAKLGALTTIAALGGSVYRFEATTWPIPADGAGVIAVTGGRWVKHYGTFNPEPVSMIGAGGQRQPNSSVATPTKLVGYTGGAFSRSFYYSVYNESSTQDLAAGTNIGLTVLADGQPVTAQLSGKIEITLVGYVGASGVLDTAPANGLPSILYDYTNIGQVFLPVALPSGSQAVYRLRFNYSAADFSQPVRSISVNLSPYATAPKQAPWAGLAGDNFIADSGGRFKFFPGIGLSGQVDDGQITINRYESPVTPEQTVIGFAASTAGQLAIANATGQVLRQPAGYTPGPGEILLATVGTTAGEHIRTNLGSVTLVTAGGVSVTVTNPVDAGGRATIRSNYSDSRIAGQSGFCRFNPISIVIYLTNGATTYRSVVTPLNQTSQTFTLNAPGSTVTAPVAANFGLFQPTSASATTTTGTIPAGTYQISIGYLYDGNQITAIAHNPAFSIYNGNAAGILGAHETTYNHGSFINLTQAQALVTAHETAFNHGNFATNAGVAATYLTQANAATLYKPLTTDDSVATGLRFTLKTVITGTPAIGEVQFNNATLASVTSLLISESGRDGTAIAGLLGMLQQATRIIIQSEQLEGVYAWFEISGAPTDSGVYRTVPVTFVTAPTGITTVAELGAAAAELTVNFYGAGGSGSGVGSGLRFQYISSVSIAEDDGYFAHNGTTFANATQVSFSAVEDQPEFPNTVDVLLRLTTGAIFEVRKSATAFARYRSTGTPALDVSGNSDCYNIAVVSEAVGPDAIGTTDSVYLMILSDAPAAAGAPGTNAIFTVSGTPPNIPSVGAQSTYSGDSAAGIAVGQRYGFSGIAGTLTAISKTATSVVLENVDVTVGAVVAAGTILAPVGQRGQAGVAGTPAIATTVGANPNTPTIGNSATYTFDTTLGLSLAPYVFSGIVGTFLITAIPSATTATLQNVDATGNAAIAAGTRLTPTGQRGTAGAPGGAGTPRGEWSNAISNYVVGNIVSYQGSSYFVIAAVPINTPPPNAAYYQYIAQKGDQGIQGVQGIQGIQGIQGVQGPTGGLTARQTETIATGSIAAGATFSGNATLARASDIVLIRSTNSTPCRVRLYDSATSRATDSARAVGVVPSTQTGVIEVILSAANNYSIKVTPVNGYRLINVDPTPTDNVPFLVTNNGAVAADPTLEVIYIKQEL